MTNDADLQATITFLANDLRQERVARAGLMQAIQVLQAREQELKLAVSNATARAERAEASAQAAELRLRHATRDRRTYPGAPVPGGARFVDPGPTPDFPASATLTPVEAPAVVEPAAALA